MTNAVVARTKVANDEDELLVLDETLDSLVDPDHPSHRASVALINSTIDNEMLTQEATDMLVSKTRRSLKKKRIG